MKKPKRSYVVEYTANHTVMLFIAWIAMLTQIGYYAVSIGSLYLGLVVICSLFLHAANADKWGW